VVAERFGENKVVRKDMLGSFIKNGLTQEEAGSETLLQIIAGSDTTATAIRATLLHLISTPSAYTSLRDEIDAAIALGNISSPVKDTEGRKLPYLQAVIKEGLRIWPPVTGLMSKTVPKGGDTLGGVFVPGGTEVGYCAWGLQRIKSIYGEDADIFRPERWLDADVDRVKEMERTVDLVFVYGKWQCPGKSVAAIELNKVFVEVSPSPTLEVGDIFANTSGHNSCSGDSISRSSIRRILGKRLVQVFISSLTCLCG
jgi:cytochrome P450